MKERALRTTCLAARHGLARAALSLVALCAVASAQAAWGQSPREAAPVTASSTDRGLRFSAPPSVVRMHLEVLDELGETLVEASSKGSVVDWALDGDAGQAVPDGTYFGVVTVEELSGGLMQRVGTVTVLGGVASVGAVEPAELSAAQRQRVGPLDAGSALVVVGGAEGGDAAEPWHEAAAEAAATPAVTLTAHDGHAGQVVSTTDALSFRLGDFFAGRDSEAMRLTEEGLTVSGSLRVRGGIRFDDGSELTSARGIESSPRSSIAAGLFGADSDAGPDSGVTSRPRIDTAGRLALGTGTPAYQLHVAGRMRAVSNASNDIVVETTGGTNAWARLWMSSPAQAWSMGTSQNYNGNQFYLDDSTLGQARMTIQPAGGAITFPLGNVGVGTGNPTSRLHVAGDLTIDAVNPIILTGTGGAELDRYLHLINSNGLQSASGLKAGGILVADSYLFANPGKNSLVVKGTATIGAASAPSGVGLYAAGAVVGAQGAGSSQGVRGEGGVYGVFGRATNTSNSYGVYGQNANTCATCYSGYFDGTVKVTQSLSVALLAVDGGGTFGGTVFAPEFYETSDRDQKTNFATVDPRSVLAKLAAIPIQTWNFKSQPESVRHMGPMAQDFHAAFGLGLDDKHISTLDSGGVSLAAIQGLYQILQEKEREIEDLRARLVRLERAAGE